MSNLNALYDAHIARLKKSGAALTEYACPDCQQPIETLAPPNGQQFSSMVTCPHREKQHFKVVHDDGRVECFVPFITCRPRTGGGA